MTAQQLLGDLQTPRPAIYWLDFLLTALIGWTAFGFAAQYPLSLVIVTPAIAISVLALYRGLCFVHEISHINRRSLRGFETTWNFLIGFPLLMPSFVYTGVHQSHHSLATYGTAKDPEYRPFARSKWMTVCFALQSFLMPAGLLVRFLVLAPAGLLFPGFHRWLVVHASALTMNFAYTREAAPALVGRVRRDSMLMLLLWGAAIAVLPVRVFLLWFIVVSAVSFVNTLRTLAAHLYESTGDPFDRSGQLQDSVDVPGKAWTELWAPVGLRFHALHHYFPGIPYHNLRKAHQRLAAANLYRSVERPGLLAALRSLYLRASVH